MSVFTTQLQQLYVTFFNRPADAAGLSYWSSAADAGVSLDTIAASFAASNEFKALYGGKLAAELVKAAYQNLFNRVAEPAGVDYWSGVIETGAMSDHEALMAIVRGARDNDAVAATNKVAAAQAFTEALDTPAKQAAYANLKAQALAGKWLGGVTDFLSYVMAKSVLPKLLADAIDLASGTVKGTLADGYIKGAIVFADTNNNGVWDEGEAKTTTDAQGNFTLAGGIGTLISIGGTDIATGSAVNGSFKAPAGSTMISPLTTLVQSVASNGNMSVAQAETLVKQKLGIADTVKLSSYDPIASAVSKDASTEDKATALKVQSLAAQVNTVMGQVGAVLSGAGVTQNSDGGANAASSALADLIVKADNKVDLGSSDAAKQIVKGAAAKVGADDAKLANVDKLATDAGKAIANLNQAIDAASSKPGAEAKSLLTEIAKVQVVAESVEKSMESGAKGGDVSASVGTTTGSALSQAVNNAAGQVGDITPTAAPTVAPTVAPTDAPTVAPTAAPTIAPTAAPTPIPTVAPTAAPTSVPTTAPTVAPTAAPTAAPTLAPTEAPTVAPTVAPTAAPTAEPTVAPTVAPTAAPTAAPTEAPKTFSVKVNPETTVLEFGGTATGIITMKVDAAHVATFARDGITASVAPNLDSVAKLVVGPAKELHASAAHLSGVKIEGGGIVVVTELKATPAADLASIGTAQVKADLTLADETLMLNGTLGKAALAVHGQGTLNIDGVQIGTATFVLDAGTTLSGPAAVLSGITVSGAGNVVVVDPTASTDLSHLTVGKVDISVLSDTNITANTKLGKVYSYDVNTGAALTLTAAQANQAVLAGNGSVNVLGSDGDQTLKVLNAGAGMVSGGQGADRIELADGAQVLAYAFGGAPAVRSVDNPYISVNNASSAKLIGIAGELSSGDTLQFTFLEKVYVATLSGGAANLQNAIDGATSNGEVLGGGNVVATIVGNDIVLKTQPFWLPVADGIFLNGESVRVADSGAIVYDTVTNFQVGKDKIQLLDAADDRLAAPSSLVRFPDVNGNLVNTAQKLSDLVFKSANFQGLGMMQAGLINVTTGEFAGSYLYVHRPEQGGQKASQDLLIKLANPVGLGPVGILNVADYFAAPLDTTPPVATFSWFTDYQESNRTLTLTGTKFSTIFSPGENPNKDIKAYLDWDKLVWQGGGASSLITLDDVESVHVTGEALAIVLTPAKHAMILAASGYPFDYGTFNIMSGFIKDQAGNAATTDAIVGNIVASRYRAELGEGDLAPNSKAMKVELSAAGVNASSVTVDASGIKTTTLAVTNLEKGKTLNIVNADQVQYLNIADGSDSVYRESYASSETDRYVQGDVVVSSSSIVSWSAGRGNDILTYTGSGKAFFSPRGGADVLTGGTGANSYLLLTSSSDLRHGTQELIAAADTITNWNAAAANTLSFGEQHLPVTDHTGAAVSGQARISKAGLATFALSDSTLALKVAAVKSALSGELSGALVVFNHEGNAYVIWHHSVYGDSMVKLNGVNAKGIVLDSNNLIVGFEVASATPVAKITSIDLDMSAGLLRVSGEGFNSLLSAGESAATQLKANFDWSKVSLKIGAETISISSVNVTSAKVANDGSLVIELAGVLRDLIQAKSAVEPTGDMSFTVATGFLKNSDGIADTLDAAAGDVHRVANVVMTDDAMRMLPSYADHLMVDAQVDAANADASQVWADSVNAFIGAGKSLTVTHLDHATQISALGQNGNLIASGSRATRFEGGNGNDTLTSTSTGSVTFIGGAGADVLTGGTGANTFVYTGMPGEFNAGSAAQLIAGADTIANWSAGAGNTISFGGTPLQTVDHLATPNATKAGLSTSGLATFDASDDTLERKVTAVSWSLDNAVEGTTVVFNHGSDAYLFVVGNSTAGVQAGDALIKVAGVTATGLNLQDGMVTGFAGVGGPVNLVGSDNADVLAGTAFNDKLNGGLGNDTLDGGAGTDTAVFSGAIASSTVTKTADGYTIQGPSGTDTLLGVELLQFNDSALALDIEGTAGQVYRMYELAFNRTPGKAELGYWMAQMDAGMSLVDVAGAYQGSSGFQGGGHSVVQFVNYLYLAAFNRNADTTGLLYWASRLSNKEASIPEVMAYFSEQPEHKAKVADLIGQGIEYTPFG